MTWPGDFEEGLIATSNAENKKVEEIHLIIRYPIMESWERLNCVDSVRWKTVQRIKEVATNLWTGTTVEEIQP